MSEQSVLGCGLFAEGEWANLITHEGAPSGPLFEHALECALCRAELDAFASLTTRVSRAVNEQRPTRAAFVDGVLAAVQHERQRAKSASAERHDRRDRRDPRSQPIPWWRPRPAAIAATAVVAVFAVLGTGLWSWPWSTPRSSGEVLPGGIIVKATNGRSSTVRAAGRSADAAAAAVAGSGATVGAETGGTGRPIRVTLGIQIAVSADVGGDSNVAVDDSSVHLNDSSVHFDANENVEQGSGSSR